LPLYIDRASYPKHLSIIANNMNQALRIAFIPFFPRLGTTPENFKKIEDTINICLNEKKPDIIFFPELSTSGYLLENLTFSSALSVPDDIPGSLVKLSHKVEIHLGLPLIENGRIFNAHIVILNGSIVHVHRKIYLPTYGLFDEGRYFTPGASLSSYEGKLGKSAILICEDAFHPALVYSLYESGVKHLFVPSCSPARGINHNEPFTASYMAWKKRLEVYSESFGIFCYYQNRGGSEDGVYFDGKSIFVSPNMTAVEKDTKKQNEDIFYYDVNLQDLSAAYQRGGPFHDENFDLNHRLFTLAGQKNRT